MCCFVGKRLVLFCQTNLAFLNLLHWFLLTEIQALVLFGPIIIEGLKSASQNYLLLLLDRKGQVLLFIEFVVLFVVFALFFFSLKLIQVPWMIQVKVIIWDWDIFEGHFQIHRGDDKSIKILHAEAGVVKTRYDHIDLNLWKVAQLNLIEIIHHENIIFLMVLFQKNLAFLNHLFRELCACIRNQKSKYLMLF